MRKCPICQSGKHELVWSTVVACADCGLVYDHEPAAMDYNSLEAYSLAEPEPKQTQRTVHMLTPYIGKNALEIGCGRGELLAELHKRTAASGLDLSHANVEACRTKGLRVAEGTILDVGPMGEFDLIVLAHVLEHLTDPICALNKMRDWLSPKGYVYVEVPDATRHLDHLTVPFQEFSPEHINHFSPLLLVRILQMAGLEAVTIGTRSIPLPNGDLYPAMGIIAKRGAGHSGVRDEMLPWLMRAYAEKSENKLQAITDHVLKQLNGSKAIAWGAGVLANHLLPRLEGKVTSIVDRDKSKQGRVIAGIRVTAPPPNGNDPILITSIANAPSIHRDLRAAGIKNAIVDCDYLKSQAKTNAAMAGGMSP